MELQEFLTIGRAETTTADWHATAVEQAITAIHQIEQGVRVLQYDIGNHPGVVVRQTDQLDVTLDEVMALNPDAWSPRYVGEDDRLEAIQFIKQGRVVAYAWIGAKHA